MAHGCPIRTIRPLPVLPTSLVINVQEAACPQNARTYHVPGSAYVKTTPTTSPTIALPIASTPADDNVIPVGSAAPPEAIPKVPPLVTPLGSVALKSSVAPLPTTKDKGPTFQACGGGGGLGAGAGDGLGAGEGDGLGAGEGLEGDEGAGPSAEPPQPVSRVAQPYRLNVNALRRLLMLLIGSFG